MKVRVPIKCVRHPVAIFRRPDEYAGVRPVIFDFLRSAYYKPEGNRLLFEGSLETELDEAGDAVDPDGYNEGITFDEVTKYSTWAAEALPVMGTKGLYERGYAGVYDNTPDQQPVIDELSEFGWENLYCVIGLSGHGFKLCPEFGRILSEMVLNGRFRDYDVSIFGLKRFSEGKLLRGRYPVSTIG
jgi:sarcosine oxidase, subunit beta